MEREKNTNQTTFVVCLSCHAADTDRCRSETRGVLASNQETFLSASLPCLFAVHVELSKLTVNYNYNCNYRRSQWPRGLRRRSLAARLLRLWVRIPPRAWIFVCCECCVLSLRRTDHFVQRSPTECGASLCVIKKPRKRGG